MVSSQSWEILELKILGEPCLDASCMYSWLPFFVCLDALCHMYRFPYICKCWIGYQFLLFLSGGGAVFVDAPFLGVGCTLPYVTLSLWENVESADSSCCFVFFKGVWGGVFLCVGTPWVRCTLPYITTFPYVQVLNQLTVPVISFFRGGLRSPDSNVIRCSCKPWDRRDFMPYVSDYYWDSALLSVYLFFSQHKCIPSFVCCEETVADDGACVYQVSRAVCCSSAKSKWSVLPWTDWMRIYCQFDRAGSQWMLWDLIFKMFIVEFMDTLLCLFDDDV